MNNRTFLLASTISAALVLSACGGGGGGAGPAAPVVAPAPVVPPAPVVTPASPYSTISAPSSTKVASNAHAANDAISTSSSSVTDLLTGVSIEGRNIGAVAPALGLINRAYNRGAPRLLTGVALTESCSGGGTVSINGTVKNQDVASNGDTLTIIATNCTEGGVVINGGFTMTLSGISGIAFGPTVWAATIDIQFNAFRITTGGESGEASGDMKLAMSQTSPTAGAVTITGKSFQSSESKAGVNVANLTMTDYSVVGTSQGAAFTSAANYTLSGNSTALGQFTYSVKNLQPFVSVDGGTPTAGSFIVNGASSSVTMTVVAGANVRLDYSAKGDGVITQTSTVSWASFLSSM